MSRGGRAGRRSPISLLRSVPSSRPPANGSRTMTSGTVCGVADASGSREGASSSDRSVETTGDRRSPTPFRRASLVKRIEKVRTSPRRATGSSAAETRATCPAASRRPGFPSGMICAPGGKRGRRSPSHAPTCASESGSSGTGALAGVPRPGRAVNVGCTSPMRTTSSGSGSGKAVRRIHVARAGARAPATSNRLTPRSRARRSEPTCRRSVAGAAAGSGSRAIPSSETVRSVPGTRRLPTDANDARVTPSRRTERSDANSVRGRAARTSHAPRTHYPLTALAG